jgi:hypothetical protein
MPDPMAGMPPRYLRMPEAWPLKVPGDLWITLAARINLIIVRVARKLTANNRSPEPTQICCPVPKSGMTALVRHQIRATIPSKTASADTNGSL